MAQVAQLPQSKRATVAARKRARFLELVRDGRSVVKAAEGAKLDRRSLYRLRAEDAEFAREWDDAYEQGTDFLEDVAHNRAVDGSDLMLIFTLKGRRPAKYRDNVKHEIDAKLTVTVEDARAQLEQRLSMIEDHRRRARPDVDGVSRELEAGGKDT